MARQVGRCRFFLVAELPDRELTSQWAAIGEDVEILVVTRNDHDTAMELLVCLGQILWERLSSEQLREYWQLLYAEFQAGIPGEIDNEALAEKRRLLRNHFSARSRSRLERYARSSFAETAAEFVHCLWHDVRVVRGPDRLPRRQLQRRLELFSQWFPPGRRARRLLPGSS